MRGLQFRLAAAGHSVNIEQFDFKSWPGKASITGALAWPEPRRWSVDLKAAFDRYPIPSPAGPLGQLTTTVAARVRAEQTVTGSVEFTQGELNVPRGAAGRELHPVSLPPDIHVQTAGAARPAPSMQAQLLAGREARIAIKVPRGFWIRTPEATVDVSANTTAILDGQQVALAGRVEVHRGDVIVATRRFTVEHLYVQFTGAPQLNPVLDGLLRYDHQDMKIEVALTGTMRKPKIQFSSDPPMPENEIAMLIATGAHGSTESSGPTGLAMSAALNVVGGAVKNALGSALPLDVLDVELGPRGEASRLEAGTYVTPDLFVSFVRNLFASPGENNNEVRAEYQIRRSLSVRTNYGDRQAGSVNLTWQKRFRSAAQKRAPAPGTQVPSVGGSGGK